MSFATWEKVAIAVLVGGVALVRARLPVKIELGEAVLASAALLLVQGLIRDLVRLRMARAQAKHSAPRVTCVCAESTLGASAIVIGMLLVFALSPVVLRVPPIAWPIAVGLVSVFGFATRHLVLDWRTRRLRWEPDHTGVVVWKK